VLHHGSSIATAVVVTTVDSFSGKEVSFMPLLSFYNSVQDLCGWALIGLVLAF